ncbi:MAG: hypothetical protein BECKG1743F_GA0114225_108681 [Candidatus Kentron sp. G]|nr:MAG: hypothetical protein BECKG1743F_GA0114225_108681 [Candidatus Kentron sp. G]
MRKFLKEGVAVVLNSRLAGLEEGQEFKTTDDFVAWAGNHRPDLDLTHPPAQALPNSFFPLMVTLPKR